MKKNNFQLVGVVLKYYFFLIVIMVLFGGCGSSSTDERIVKDSIPIVRVESAKVNNLNPTYPSIVFSLKAGSSFFKPALKDSGIYALKVAAAVLNSQEFRDSISKYVFPCKDYGYKCETKCKNCETDNISIQTILDSLYRETNVELKLELRDCGGSVYGESAESSYFISSCYYTVYDDKKIPFTYCYADHICHEYLHNVGFYHYLKPKKRITNKDIAEKAGWVAYDILVRCYNAGIDPLKLK